MNAAEQESKLLGDEDTVNALLERHQKFKKELESKATRADFVRRSAQQMLARCDHESPQVQEELVEFNRLWADVEQLAARRDSALADALAIAKQFGALTRTFLDAAARFERELNQFGSSGTTISESAPLVLLHIVMCRVYKCNRT